MKEIDNYFYKYTYDWDLINIMIGGKSSLDSENFLAHLSNYEQTTDFIKSYGMDINNSVSNAELFGNFQEALQFIRKYFLIEGSLNGYKITIPNSVLMLSDIRDLYLMAGKDSKDSKEEQLWAEVILKIMHTILHADKDLRARYFKTIQTQILDNYYKHILRDEDSKLYLIDGQKNKIEIENFETKSKKTRDSVIMKLLHKPENVAEQLFDRIGIRIVTKNKFDTLRVLNFLAINNIVIPNNVKPSRSLNTLFLLENFKTIYLKFLNSCEKNPVDEEHFLLEANKLLEMCQYENDDKNRNMLSLSKYRSIQFTCRQLIYYRNPIFNEVKTIREMARSIRTDKLKEGDIDRNQKNIGADTENNTKISELVNKIDKLDMSTMLTELKFFYPYEVQIVDQQSNIENTEGEASHSKYKIKQIEAVKNRIFKKFFKEHLL